MNELRTPTPSDIGNHGERMTVANLWSYWAHLSIYRFALPLAKGQRVLDAGSGEGYGAAYLARGGAEIVRAFDAGAEAVAHARQAYPQPGLSYEVADLNRPLPLADRSFDLVFSSNVFEHVAQVDTLAGEVARLVTEAGTVVIAVPPITSPEALAADVENEFHVHHLPPAAWHAKLLRFFEEVQCHAHVGTGAFADRARHLGEVGLPAEQVTIRETDFAFPPVTTEALNADLETVTAIFVCRRPRGVPLPETLAERMPAHWCEGDVAARVIAAARRQARALEARLAELSAARSSATVVEDGLAEALRRAEAAEARAAELAARLAAVEGSTMWRATGPARRLLNAVRGVPG